MQIKAFFWHIFLVTATAVFGLCLLIKLQRLDAIRFEAEQIEWKRIENQKRESLKEEIITELLRRIEK